MFEVLKNFLGGNSGLVGSQSLKSVAGVDTAISQKMLAAQCKWREMYEEKSGLHLASAISFEMARMVTLDLRSKVTGSKRGEFLDKTYQKLVENIRIPVEYGCAKGGLVIKPYVCKNELKVRKHSWCGVCSEHSRKGRVFYTA